MELKEGKYTVETFAQKQRLGRQSAINLLSKLKKQGLVNTTGGGKQKRIYTVSKTPKKEPNGFFTLLNKYSPEKISPGFEHHIHGTYGVERALMDGITLQKRQKDTRLNNAMLHLFRHVKNWKLLFELAKKEGLVDEVRALYDEARKEDKNPRHAQEVSKMINTQDQEELFKLIAEYLSEDIECIAIGGTAMMFSGYKNATKDIDLVFGAESERNSFIKAIEKLGYKEKALIDVYDKTRLAQKSKPRMFTRGDERFDLFAKDVFGFALDLQKTAITQRQDFLGKKSLIVNVLPKEYLILLKSITRREKDQEDIDTIVEIEKEIDWQLIVDEAIKQRANKNWILYDLEKSMQQLRKKIFIKKQYFDQIYKAEQDSKKEANK